jgi:hypothetical protein
MSIHKEGYHALNVLQSQEIRIYEDACDFGVPVRKNDSNWNLSKMLFSMHGDRDTRQQQNFINGRGRNVYSFITLIDEWSVSDGRKTLKEATDTYSMCYTSYNTGKCKGYDGYISIRKVS